MSGARKPSRRKPSATSRLRRWWIVFAFVLILGAIGAVFAATWPALDPHRISVAGNRIVSSDQILAAASIDPHRNLWLQNSHAIASRVEAIPFVDRAWLHRRLLADAIIVVTERTPFAIVRVDGTTLLIDRRLRVLASGDTDARVPQIDARPSVVPDVGDTLNDATVRALGADLGALEASGVDAADVAFDRYGGLIATRRDGMKILLGDDDDLPRKLSLIAPIEKQTAGGRPIRTIDLRTPATPVIVYRT